MRKAAEFLCVLCLWGASHSSYASVNGDLIAVASLGDASQVRRLLAEGAEINAADGDGMTALHASLRYRFDDATTFRPSSMAGAKYLDVVKFLTDHGADVNAASYSEGLSPLHVAASNGFRDAAELLITRGAKVDARSRTGSTPLLLASRYLDVSKLLILKGADLTAKDNYGWTVLHNAAVFRGNAEYIRFMLSKGADVNGRRFDGQTPLHKAAENQVEDAAVLLISNGADVNAKDNAGNTPYDIARKSMKSDFESLFLPVIGSVKPSINCSNPKVLNYVEGHVCKFPPLTVLDSKLNDAYATALKVAKHSNNLREEQRGWVRERDRICKEESYQCSMADLMRMYGERIEQLSQVVADPSTRDGKDLCIDLIQLADAKKLTSYAIRDSRAPTDQELANLNGAGEGRLSAIYEIQLNRANPAEKFGRFSTGGTCASFQIFNLRRILETESASKGWVEVYDPNEIIRWAYWGGGDYPIEYRGQFFMITADLADENRVNMVSSILPDGNILPICTVEEASFKYVADTELNSVCEKIARGAIHPITWKKPDIELASGRVAFVSKFGRYADTIAWTRIDLDGDGIMENVGRFSYSSGAGCGSEQAWGRVLSDDLRSALREKLDDLISQLGRPFDVYVHAGVHYIRSSVSGNLDQVVRVRDGRVEKICELHRRSKSRPKVLFEAK